MAEEKPAEAVEGNDIDAALAEFEASVAPAEPVKPAVVEPRVPARPAPAPLTGDEIAATRHFLKQSQTQVYEATISKTVDRMIEHQPGLKQISEKLLKARLDVAVDEDPRIGQAFLNSAKNPQAWGKILVGLSEEIAKELDAIPNPRAADDRGSAQHLAAGRVSSVPPAPKVANEDLSKMSDAEFAAWKRAEAARVRQRASA